MDLSPTAYRFTVKDYHRMAEGVPEVWVVDVNAGVVHVAAPGARRTVARGESLAPQAFPDLVLEVPAIVG